jgi:hypothetical protein
MVANSQIRINHDVCTDSGVIKKKSKKMSFLDNQEPQSAASTTNTNTTTIKRKHDSGESIGALADEAKKRVVNSAESTTRSTNASLSGMPLWVCAEILSFLDLASILNLTEVSVGVRLAFRTPVAAASIMANIVGSPCSNHKVDLTADSGDTAWTKLRQAFNMAWASLLGLARKDCANANGNSTCGTLIAAMVDKRFTAQNLHEQRCCRAAAAESAASRRASVVAALARLRIAMPEIDEGVQQFIKQTSPLSLHQCIAEIKCENHLTSTGEIFDYPDSVARMINLMTRSKFQHNRPWLAVADEVIRVGFRADRRRRYVDDWSGGGYDSEDYGQDEVGGLDDIDDEMLFKASLLMHAQNPNWQFF